MTRGLFVTGTDTGVGKTYVACLVARSLVSAGYRVGVYKPAESGCRVEAGQPIAADCLALWEAAGRPGAPEQVCPQRFAAPVAPHLAARQEDRRVDPKLLRAGFTYWRENSDIVLVEGAGGLMSPLSDDDYNADLAEDFALPLLVVSPNVLGTINGTLQTLIAAATFRDGLPIAGIVLNRCRQSAEDHSIATNRQELEQRCVPPILAEVPWQGSELDANVDWYALAAASPEDA